MRKIYIAIIELRNTSLADMPIKVFGNIAEAQYWVDKQLADMEKGTVREWDIIERII